MEIITVSSKGQIAIPKRVREQLNIAEGAKLILSVRGQELILSREAVWKSLRGTGRKEAIMTEFAAHRKQEREREDPGA